MMNKPTIIFLWRRGMVTQCYDDAGPNFGFSGRASYAMGMNKPNYPVPALRTDTLYWRLPTLGIYSKELGYKVTVQTLINAWQLWRN